MRCCCYKHLHYEVKVFMKRRLQSEITTVRHFTSNQEMVWHVENELLNT
jgi:hypothetical protein